MADVYHAVHDIAIVYTIKTERRIIRPKKFAAAACAGLPWISELSTVNNKLKRREGSGSTGRFFD
jgi:hypothetical protein